MAGCESEGLERELTISPRGLLTSIHWEGFKGIGYHFDIHWDEQEERTKVVVKNHGPHAWEMNIGFRPFGSGAEYEISWKRQMVNPGEELIVQDFVQRLDSDKGLDKKEIVKRECDTFGDNEKIIFMRYGAAYFADPVSWDLSKVPLALRFVIGNGTMWSWNNLSVELLLPDGWEGAGRPPGERTSKGTSILSTGHILLQLQELMPLDRTVAAFEVYRPNRYLPEVSWTDYIRFHERSQPGPDIHLQSKDVTNPEKHKFKAILKGLDERGKVVKREIGVTVNFLPYLDKR
jgi:hypothetical protein